MDEQTKPVKRRNRVARNRRAHNTILAGSFLLLLVLALLINLIVRDRDYSDTEQRSLAQRPAFSLNAITDGSYFSALSEHYSDQFFARDSWISLHLKWSQLTGSRESGSVLLCSNDYLMQKPLVADPVALPAVETAINTFTALHADLNSYLLVVPAETQILTKYLPQNAPVADQLDDLNSLSRDLASSIHIFDTVSALRAHADEDIYYHTDPHWTTLGAGYVFEAVAAEMALDTTGINYSTLTVTDSFEGTLSAKSGSHSYLDTIQICKADSMDFNYYVSYDNSGEKICSLYDLSCLSEADQYTVFFGGNHAFTEIRTTTNNNRSLLIFQDSFANCFVQYLLPYFENIIMLNPCYYSGNVENLISTYSITDVLYLYGADTFLTDDSLAKVLNTAIDILSGNGMEAPTQLTSATPVATTETTENASAEKPITDESAASVIAADNDENANATGVPKLSD